MKSPLWKFFTTAEQATPVETMSVLESDLVFLVAGPWELPSGHDRVAMLVSGEDSIREVIAFSKNNKGADPMAECTTTIDFKSLRDLCPHSTYKQQQEAPVA